MGVKLLSSRYLVSVMPYSFCFFPAKYLMYVLYCTVHTSTRRNSFQSEFHFFLSAMIVTHDIFDSSESRNLERST